MSRDGPHVASTAQLAGRRASWLRRGRRLNAGKADQMLTAARE
jgi:hypothetical protein